jgi:ribonuclease HI
MREVWELPPEELFQAQDNEWLLNLLMDISEDRRVRILLIIWRIWHNHNELTHDKPCPSIEGSRRFLLSYLNSLLMIKQFPSADIQKGKMVVNQELGFSKHKVEDGRQKVRKRWELPKEGMLKLNVDGAFTCNNGAGTGMILRDHKGEVVFAACRQLRSCCDVTEAELMALEEGIKLALAWSSSQFSVETDCQEVCELLDESTPNLSIHAFRINEIRELLRVRGSKVIKISRDCNKVSDALAKLGRVKSRTAVWLRNYPTEVAEAIQADCNPLDD